MKQLASLLAVLLSLAACVPAPVSPPQGMTVTPARCRVGPDGGAPLADRGIGGTGGPLWHQTDRGIGGTGGPAAKLTDRGIGGTGITGVVTGFASVCVDGLEVALDDKVAVDIDGVPASQAALRVGQAVAINAGPPDAMPTAATISVRHEVSGPVEAVLGVNPGLIVVAGQRVRVLGRTAGSMLVQPGAWVAVSGLRGPDGDIIASRLDPRAPGRVLVRGPLIVADGVAAIGSLAIRTERDTGDVAGTYVTVSGTWQDGTLNADNLAPDLLVSDPPAYFGPQTRRLVLESYGRFESHAAVVTGGFRAALSSGFRPPADLSGPIVMSLDRQTDGSFAVFHAGPVPGPVAPAVVPGTAPDSSRGPSGASDVEHLNAMPASQPSVPTGSRAAASAGMIQPAAGPETGAMVEQDSPVNGWNSRQPVARGIRGEAMTRTPPAPGGGSVPAGIVYGVSVGGAANLPGVSPLAGATRGGVSIGAGGAIARAGGLHLMGVGVAPHLGHALGAVIAPRAIGLHLHSLRLWPGH